jgi:hypothetical protein
VEVLGNVLFVEETVVATAHMLFNLKLLETIQWHGLSKVVIHLFESAGKIANWKGGPMSSPAFGSDA